MKRITALLCAVWCAGTPLAAGMNDDPVYVRAMFDRFETTDAGEHPLVWEGQLSVGDAWNKISFYSEGEALHGDVEESENALVYSRAVTPYWDLQAGIAWDTLDGEHQRWALLAAEGMTPYFVEARAELLFGEDGNVGLRLSAEYEAYLTQFLVLVPSLEASAYTRDTSETALGSGFSSLRAGVRLRYDIRRDFSPYVGVEWEKHYGRTGRYDPLDRAVAVAGLRFWF